MIKQITKTSILAAALLACGQALADSDFGRFGGFGGFSRGFSSDDVRGIGGLGRGGAFNTSSFDRDDALRLQTRTVSGLRVRSSDDLRGVASTSSSVSSRDFDDLRIAVPGAGGSINSFRSFDNDGYDWD